MRESRSNNDDMEEREMDDEAESAGDVFEMSTATSNKPWPSVALRAIFYPRILSHVLPSDAIDACH
jgi:hypothetical protein